MSSSRHDGTTPQQHIPYNSATPGMARDGNAGAIQAHRVFVRLVLPPYTVHFKSAGYMKEFMLDMLDKRVCKEMLKSTAQRLPVREAIGTDRNFWADFGTLLKAAIPSLERRSFTIWDPSSVDYESTSGALIASHYPGLWKDLERLNDLVSISRNVLTVGSRVQDLAAWYGMDAEIFRLVNCCVRVTARGYDGDAGTGEEEKWQWIVNAYKKLLITSLQFLNNLVAQNERRKLMLWVSLFDNTTEAVFAPEDVPETSSASLTDVPSNPTSRPIPPLSRIDLLVAFGTDGHELVNTADAQPLLKDKPFVQYPLPKEALEAREKLLAKQPIVGNGYAFFVKRALRDDYKTGFDREPTMGEFHLDMPRRWAELNDEDHEYWQGLFEDALARYRQDLAVYEAKMLAVTLQQPVRRTDLSALQQAKEVERKIAMLEEQLAGNHKSGTTDVEPWERPPYGQDGHLAFDNHSLQSRPVVADDMRMLFTAEAGTKILESGKAELMKRLEGYEHPPPSAQSLPPSRHADSATIRPSQTDELGNPIERSRSMSHSPSPCHPGGPRSPDHQHQDRRDDSTQEAFEQSADEEEGDEGDEDEDDSEEEAEEDEEEDYPGSTEDGRGLLTDVPLILGPSEIEVLPMLIMSGIVPPIDLPAKLSAEEKNALMNMHTVRTHLLLSQSNGRNLLRELLIFVAAWDLREEELYFKFMVKIMEAILKNGLMPFAYHAFRDRSRSKDIISPAQAVIMKLLTCIFRARGETAKAAVAAGSQKQAVQHPHPVTKIATVGLAPGNRPVADLPNMPSRVDIHILNFIFTEFRQHIIPQTCALIFLQGQIHAGRASPEDFPLNLWDMERMYEGVYQYLEFFAVLTEEGVWKGILGEWEMASELVTLLRELEGGIPKMGAIVPQMPRRVSNHPSPQRALSADAAAAPPAPVHPPAHPPTAMAAPAPSQHPAPVSIERPFDVDLSNPNTLPPLPRVTPDNQRVYEADTPLAYPEDPAMPLAHDLPHDQDEPSDFEWRNLKKLTVLVLSSLIWKNRTVQDQVRRYGGLEALVGCCRNDEHNPYIREHAIMCLRFAVENCEDNAKVIRRMAAAQGQRPPQGGGNVKSTGGIDLPTPTQPTTTTTTTTTLPATEDVPREVLDTNGYETFMDPKGQVGLRRKEGPQQQGQQAASSSSSGGGAANAGVQKPRLSSTKLTAERAAELMSSALSSLPLGDKLGIDKGKLAQLDRMFEHTEKVLGRGKKG